MEALQLRLELVNTGGKTIACLYHREAFDLLGIEVQQNDYQLLEEGQIINYDESEYQIVSIKFKMLTKLYSPDEDLLNIDSPTDPSPFNCLVLAYVERTA